jgi:hypothetical protein
MNSAMVFLKQALDVVHAAHATCLQQFPNLGAALDFFRTAISLCHIVKTSIVMLPFYTSMQVYTKFGIVSVRRVYDFPDLRRVCVKCG